MRDRQVLDGTWDFQFSATPQTQPTKPNWDHITVPIVWQAQFENLRNAAGTGWYRREIVIPKDWHHSAVILHIGAAYHLTTVWVNDIEVGTHTDGYLPFELEISPYLNLDTPNRLLIRVVSPSEDETLYPDYLFSQIPHGKQSWYGHLGGIWQSVWIERRAKPYIQHAALNADFDSGQVQLDVTLSETIDSCYCTLQIQNHQVTIPCSSNPISLVLTISSPKAWSPDTPYLYEANITLSTQSNERLDQIKKQFGFRKIETRDGKLYLNNNPIYLRGALDQDYYPDTITTPPSIAFLEDQFQKAKAMGLNCLRMHIKLADPRYYEAADRIGILLWVDYPNWSHTTTNTQTRLKTGLQRMLQRDGHHPSIIIWTIINEDWGTDLVGNANHRAWLKEIFNWLKAADPTRLIIDNSPCYPNFHIQTDLNDYHFYAAMPDNISGWNEFVERFSLGDYTTFSPHGDAHYDGEEPRIISEFGNWGLPDLNKLADANGIEPWWTETGSEWGDGAIYPHAIQHRFRLWHLQRVFGSWESFIAASQWNQFQALSHEIDTIRLAPQIQGYIITEFTDVHWEANGLLDIKRNHKIFADYLPTITGETTLIPRLDQESYWVDSTITLRLTVSHKGNEPLTNVALTTLLDNTPHLEKQLNTIEAHQDHTITIHLKSPTTVSTPHNLHLAIHLKSDNGHVITERELSIPIYPRLTPKTSIWSSSERLMNWAASLGYPVAPYPERAQVIITNTLTKSLNKEIQAGKRILLLAENPEAIPSEERDPMVIAPYFPYTRVVTRQHTVWEGNWASTMGWIRLPSFQSQVIDKRFLKVIPRHVLVGFTPLDFESNVFAGLFAGWIQRPVALAARRKYGTGSLTISTFQLTDAAQSTDPVTQTLVHDLIHTSLK